MARNATPIGKNTAPHSGKNILNDQDFELLDSIEVPIFVLELNKAGELVYVAFNRAACKVANIKPSDFIGKTAKEVYRGRLGKLAYQQHVDTMMSCLKTTYELTLPLNGKERRIKTTLNPVMDVKGRFKRLIGTSEEITTQYRTQELELKMTAIDADIEQFVHLAAHDLRTPMNNIKLITDELRIGFNDLGDGKLELIDLVETVSQRAFRMIDDLLQHAQIVDSENSEAEFNLDTLCQEILVTLDPCEKHAVTVVDCVLFGDKNATQVVLRNLIDNAFKHNPGQSISVTISAGSIHSMFEVTVQDNGVGFEDPAIALLAGRQSRSGKGGFGLRAIKRLIKSRGGTISAGKNTSGGALVRFSLPGTCSSGPLH